MIAALFVAAGALVALGAPQLPGDGWPWAAGLALAPLGFAGLRRSLMVSSLAAFLLGFAVVAVAGSVWLGLRVDASRSRVLVEARIEDLPAREGAVWRFDAQVRAQGPAARDPRLRRARIVVADQGEGLSAEQQARAFDKFERLGRKGDGGSGLGLYISRRLARAMDGDLTVESAPGQGARFILELPSFDERRAEPR